MSLNDISNRNLEVGQVENSDEEDDGVPKLSAQSLKALQEFYSEYEASETKKIDENWNLSQFWYDEKTSETLAQEVFANAVNSLKSGERSEFNICCISCPTLFKTLHEYLTGQKEHIVVAGFSKFIDRINCNLFEYDKRFDVYGHDYFSFYDYTKPLEVDLKFQNHFDLIITDPPYLSQECHIKTGVTIRMIGKENHKLIVCTGAIMEELLAASLKVKLVKFIPRHERNLANEFKCYANYETLFLNE